LDCELLSDTAISRMEPLTLLSATLLSELYDVDEEVERIRITAVLQAKAKEYQIEKEFATVIKAYDKANKTLAAEYTRMNRENSCNIQLQFNSNDKPAETIDNFLQILREDEKFAGVKFNLLTKAPEIHNILGKSESWEDSNDSDARNYIENKYKLYSPTKLDDALKLLFAERSYHPVKDIIEATKWDGTDRIKTLLIKWLKADDNDYVKEVSRLIFAGGINRLYRPGCKFDDVPILIGTKQGEGKSTFVRWLALNDSFFNEVGEIEGQKGIEAVKGAWICELSELLALTKTKEVEAVKSYITRLEDVYRQPYDKRVSSLKRQCIFIGTTNKERFLTDKTGNRRFYPIKINQTGYELFNNENAIKDDILQCWAEAKYKFDNTSEMQPFPNKELLSQIKSMQNDAVEDDYRDGMISEYLKDKTEVCILELWQKALKNDFSKPSKRDSGDIALILQNHEEWERIKVSKRTAEYGSQKVWVKKQSSAEIELGNPPF